VAGPDEARAVYARLSALHPEAHCELNHKNAFELVCAVVLSAQTTDVAVNKLSPALFARFPTAADLAQAEPAEVEALINTIGMYRQKTKSLIGLAKRIMEVHGGEVPRTLDELVKLPGVGRKTANVVLGVAFGTPEGVVVDTHVQRLSPRWKWTTNDEPIANEQDLMKLLPKEEWDHASHVLIFHGRRVCFAIKPNCKECGINDVCPSAFRAEEVGRKPPRPPRVLATVAKAVAKVAKKTTKNERRNRQGAKNASR
jgi:endonuclease-3